MNSIYWKSEIERTQLYMSQLVHGEMAGVKSTKSSDDTLTLQDVEKEMEKCQKYIGYCQTELEKALAEENGVDIETKSILYFERDVTYV